MTDTSFPPKPIHGPDLSHAALSSAFPLSRHLHYHAPADVDIPEDDGQISCICGFADDDGWTVACDSCNRWQHQSCYYPQYDERTLPEEVQHYCVDCKPRDVDKTRAHLRQREKRDHTEASVNGVKRSAPKSHKKKVKEQVYTNGTSWPLDKVRHDRNSASPRDQQPPAKRPKTAHRTSDSTTTTTITTTTTKGHSRKRNASSANHRRSLSRSPDSPIDQYSAEFLQCYRDDDWSVTDANLHNSIGITNALTEWLNANDDEFRTAHNSTKGEVLMRWDDKLENIPGKAQIDILHDRDDSVVLHGQQPVWKFVAVKEPVPVGAYIGELKGHIDFKKNYQMEDGNRWSRLRHPEPFVFFHPRLPIVIDARNEGTELRYVRRSCMPNARLQILVTDNVDYHFCFMATQQIDPGVEVSVGWDTADGLPELASRSELVDDELELLSSWVSTALANCGPCACSLPENECMMSRFDRRVKAQQDGIHFAKAPKPKRRKAGQQISPLNTHVNSRSGSEARKVDVDDEGTDSRSASGSAGRGSASRDITPNTHYSANGVGSEISERERKKLAKEEEIFRRQEEEQAGKQAKKKRNSAGSSLSTPSATSSKQLGFPPNSTSKYVDAGTGTSKQAGFPVKSMLGRKPKTQKGPPRPISRFVKRSKPVYVDSEVQCDMDQEEASRRTPRLSGQIPYISTRQRLLELCARNNHAVKPAPKPQIPAADAMDVDPPPSRVTTPKLEFPVDLVAGRKPAANTDPPPNDVDMEDASLPALTAPHTKEVEPTNSVDVQMKEPDAGSEITKHSSPRALSPVKTLSPESGTSEPTQMSKTQMHLEMPPPSANPFAQAPPQLSAAAVGSLTQSPVTLGTSSMFSPSIAAAISPSPARKKLSLSDYTRRKKDKDNETKPDRESSPASTASGPVAAPLQPSSSAEASAASGSAIDEDTKMDDAPQADAARG